MVENVEAQRYCSLYVNDMHLIVMLIPYIERELEKDEKIVTILENDLDNEIDTIIKKINLGKVKKNRIKNINWKKNLLSYEQIAEIVGKTVLVKGSYEFINSVNSVIKADNRVINCYDIDTFEGNSREILEHHNAILNTSGVKKISEMFQINKRLNGILTK